MATYDLDATTSFRGTSDVAAQGLVEAMTGIVLPRREAKQVLDRIPDHKWLLSEQLGRDVGMKVAAIDLIENFYAPVPKDRLGILVSKVWNSVRSMAARYVEAKGNAMPV
jgi:hypothetical protein